MSTEKQIHANRLNAQHSTGPRTEAGKQASSRNAFKHGLAADAFVIDGEDPDHYEEALAQMMASYGAETTDEQLLVEQILQGHILAQRARHNLQEYYFVSTRGQGGKLRYIDNVTLITRYLTQHERSIARANEMFYQNRKLRREQAQPAPVQSITSQPNGFVPQNEKPGVRQLLKLAKPEPKPVPIA